VYSHSAAVDWFDTLSETYDLLDGRCDVSHVREVFGRRSEDEPEREWTDAHDASITLRLANCVRLMMAAVPPVPEPIVEATADPPPPDEDEPDPPEPPWLGITVEGRLVTRTGRREPLDMSRCGTTWDLFEALHRAGPDGINKARRDEILRQDQPDKPVSDLRKMLKLSLGLTVSPGPPWALVEHADR
jgi:hypothetical protein